MNEDYLKRDDVITLVQAYIHGTESLMEYDEWYEAQFEGFQALQDDLFNLEITTLKVVGIIE